MSSPILARADAFMQRRRQSSPEPDDVPLLTDAIGADDDIPVLIDIEQTLPVEELRAEIAPMAEPVVTEPVVTEPVVTEPTVTEPALTEPAVAEPAVTEPSVIEPAITGLAFEGEMLDIVAHELTRRVNARLTAELPGIIESTIREFLAEPEILALIEPRD